jgi:hypothetical protein
MKGSIYILFIGIKYAGVYSAVGWRVSRVQR